MKIHIGIDPGLEGAIAVLGCERPLVFDTPIYKKAGKMEYDLHKTIGIIEAHIIPTVLCEQAAVYCCIEMPIPMPRQASQSTLKTGIGFGIWRGIIACHGWGYREVHASVWKKKTGLIGSDKTASRVKAMELFPSMKESLALVKHHGRAEALLIAEYGRMVSG